VTNSGATTWFGFVRAILGFVGANPDRVEPISTADLDHARYPAPRPANSVLDNLACRLLGLEPLPDWQESTASLVATLSAQE
jgi:dTDP-4-dehydrorhamnose reductase